MDPSTGYGSFAALLRGHRVARQLTQEELAHAAGLSVRALRNAELGQVRSPRRDTVERLADALQLAPQARRELTQAARAHRLLPVPAAPTPGPTAPAPPRGAHAAPADLATITLRPGSDVVLVLRLSVTGQLAVGRFEFDAVPGQPPADPAEPGPGGAAHRPRSIGVVSGPIKRCASNADGEQWNDDEAVAVPARAAPLAQDAQRAGPEVPHLSAVRARR